MGGKTTRTEGNKLGEIQLNNATYGLDVSIVLGSSRISGNVIDYYNFTPIPHEETTNTGKGGSKTVNTNYTYTAAVIFGLAEGPGSVGKVWTADGVSSLSTLNLTVFSGAYGQTPWSYTISKVPAKALPYSGLIYAAGVMDLGDSGSVPQLNFEVKGMLRDTGDGIDVNPADAIAFICSDSVNGVGFGVGGIDGDSLERFRAFCKAADLLITVSLSDGKKAYEIINDICKATNTIVFWSQSKLKLVPKYDERIEANGVVFEPNDTPLYNLTIDDFIDDDPLVSFERADNSEAYNDVPVEFTNRASSYESETVNGEILVDINNRGRRTSSTVSLPYLHTKARAQYVADLLVKASLYGRNTYTFKLGWSYCLLEPGDFVTIYDPVISANVIPVLIDTVEEDEDGELTITAVGRKSGVNTTAQYTVHEAERATKDYNADPGDVISPVIFEVPAELSNGELQAWIAISGSNENWGGCDIWGSFDNESYKLLGTVNSRTRYGVLAEVLPDGIDPDIVNTLKVNLAQSNGTLLSGTKDDADNYRTICYVDGEIIAYQTAELTGANQYSLSYLRRGLYNTSIIEHEAGTSFVRLDDSIFKYNFDQTMVGKTIYLKFLSFNVYLAGKRSIDQVDPFTHVLNWSPAPDVDTYYAYQNFRQIEHFWTLGGDDPGATVEIRRLDPSNPVWDFGTVINTKIPGNKYTDTSISMGLSCYGIKAISSNGSYSVNTQKVFLNVSFIPSANFIVALDEFQALDGEYVDCYLENNQILIDMNDFWAAEEDEDITEDYWAFEDEEETSDDFWNLPTAPIAYYITQVKDIRKIVGSVVNIEQMTYTDGYQVCWRYGATTEELEGKAWEIFVPGAYTFRYHQWKIELHSILDLQVFSAFKISIDVPDREYKYPNAEMVEVEITDANAGITIVFPEPFLMPPVVSGSVINQDAYIVHQTTETYSIVKARNDNTGYVTGKLNLRFIGY